MRLQRTKPLAIALTTAAGLAISNLAFSACQLPAAPKLPEGKSASMEQMVAGQQSIKGFQQDNADYLQCLDKEIKTAEKSLKKAKDEAKEIAMKAHAVAVDAYNAAVAKEEALAQEFNSQVRAFKAANP